MFWASEDPANKAGFAYWDDSKLIRTTVLRAMGAKGSWVGNGVVMPSRWEASLLAVADCSLLVVEEGMGGFKTAVRSQAGHRSYMQAVCDYKTVTGRPVEFKVVNVSEWRRVIKEAYNVSWPATTERKKALSVKLVKEHFGIDVMDDEADAVLLGVAAMRMGLVNVLQNNNP